MNLIFGGGPRDFHHQVAQDGLQRGHPQPSGEFGGATNGETVVGGGQGWANGAAVLSAG